MESLSEDELRQACRDRGLLGLLSVDEMRQQVYFSNIKYSNIDKYIINHLFQVYTQEAKVVKICNVWFNLNL